MNTNDIKAQIISLLPDAKIQIEGDGVHFDVLIVSDAFEGLSLVKRQQMIYSLFTNAIQSGMLHALNLKTLTKKEEMKQHG